MLFEASRDGLMLIDRATAEIVEANRAMGLLLGVDSKVVSKRRLESVFPPARAAESVKQMLSGSADPIPVVVTLLRADGLERHVEATTASVDLEGRPMVHVVLRDVTERHKLELERESLRQALYQSQKLEALGQLASGVSHDMNNVLSVVLSCAGALRDEVSDPVHKADVDQILIASQRGRDLIMQLLAFARKEPATRDHFDLQDALREATSLCARLLPSNIRFHVDVPASTAEVVGDRSQIIQAIMNLCVNARDAMPNGGTLSVTARDDDKRVLVRVQDTGIGMSEEVLRRAFEPFFTTKPRGRGTGLGLSMVYSTVRSHGGDVRIESKVGEGTRFTLWFPLTIDDEEADDAQEQDIVPQPLGRALIIDDDDNLRRVLAHFLRHLGFEVDIASSGDEALELFRRGPVPKIAVCDLVMPGTDGAETTKRLKELAPSIPVIIASGFLDSIENERIRQAGATDVLSKPFSLEDLREALSRALDLPRA